LEKKDKPTQANKENNTLLGEKNNACTEMDLEQVII